MNNNNNDVDVDVDDNIVLNPQQQSAYDAMVRGDNVALFGDAGTGKSVVVRKFMKLHGQSGHTVCLTPTGLAARNIGEAQTIHSFFNISPGWVHGQAFMPEPRVLAILPYVKTIIIDEISMVRCDIFDLIEQYLCIGTGSDGEQPFGGKQIIVVGDFEQLSPIVSNALVKEQLEREYQGLYAFKTDAWQKANFQYYYLRGVYRQNDCNYISILNCIRHNHDLQFALDACNRRCVYVDQYDFLLNTSTMALCTTRSLASQMNINMLSGLPGECHCSRAVVAGDFPPDDYPTDYFFQFKIGAKVMILANQKYDLSIFANDNRYEYVNGDMGFIRGYDFFQGTISVELTTGKIVNVKKYTWPHYRYELLDIDGEKRIVVTTSGRFFQYPLAIAYASTIHKSQGQTLESIHLLLGRGCFASGQLYTALSRVRSLANLTLEKMIFPTDAISDPMVKDFYQSIMPISK